MVKLKKLSGLVAINSDDQLLLNLKKNVVYVILKDMEDKDRKILAKVFDISGRQTFKPDNDTAAVLLSLLVRDDGDDVLLMDYLSFIKANLSEQSQRQAKEHNPPIDIEQSIRTFLADLETNHKILKATVVPKGTQGGKDFDPVGLLASLHTWEDPDLTLCEPPICKTDTYYSAGYIAGNVHR